MADQNRFFRALFTGKVLRRHTLRVMTTPTEQSGDQAYGMGIAQASTAVGLCFFHGGFWGAISFYCPSQRVVVSATINAAPPANPAEVTVAILAAAVER